MAVEAAGEGDGSPMCAEEPEVVAGSRKASLQRMLRQLFVQLILMGSDLGEAHGLTILER